MTFAGERSGLVAGLLAASPVRVAGPGASSARGRTGQVGGGVTELAHQPDQRVLRGVEGLPVRVRGGLHVLADRGVAVRVAARVVPAEDLRVRTGVDPFAQLSGARDGDRVGAPRGHADLV